MSAFLKTGTAAGGATSRLTPPPLQPTRRVSSRGKRLLDCAAELEELVQAYRLQRRVYLRADARDLDAPAEAPGVAAEEPHRPRRQAVEERQPGQVEHNQRYPAGDQPRQGEPQPVRRGASRLAGKVKDRATGFFRNRHGELR